MHALIDGDMVAYTVAAAANRKQYFINHNGERYDFKYKKEADAFCEEEGLGKSSIQSEYAEEPIENVLHSAKVILKKIINDTTATSYDIFFTGPDNYRKGHTHHIQYKASRKDKHIPIYLQDVKDYLTINWEGYVVENAEADDAMGIAQCEAFRAGRDDTVICTLDKDLNNIPGWHYNWRTGESFFISEDEALRHFYQQLLIGDKADDIPGARGVGKMLAAKAIDPCETEEEMYDAVLELYKVSYGEEAEEWLRESALLMWIQQKEGELWQPPKERRK